MPPDPPFAGGVKYNNQLAKAVEKARDGGMMATALDVATAKAMDGATATPWGGGSGLRLDKKTRKLNL